MAAAFAEPPSRRSSAFAFSCLPQLELRQFADGGTRQRIAEFKLGRHFVTADLIGEKIIQLLKREALRPGLELDEGLGRLAAIRRRPHR